MPTLVYQPFFPTSDRRPHFLQRSDNGALMALQPGEPFEVSEADAEFLTGPCGNAAIKRVPPPPPPEPEPTPEPEAAAESVEPAGSAPFGFSPGGTSSQDAAEYQVEQ